MKTFLKISGIILGVIVLLLIIGVVYFNSAYPNVDPPSNIKVDITPARIERGKYLVHHVTDCLDCHSTRDWTKYSGPLMADSYGKGGEIFDESIGIPGKLYAKNITPAGIGDWTDGELLRAFTCGVNKDGKALFPLMPYLSYNHLTQEDAYSIVAYIRTLKPIKNNVPESKLNFPLNFIVKTIPPKGYVPAKEVDRSNKLEYGKYLVSIAGCADCHTPSEQGEPKPGMDFAGGMEFQTPWGTVRSANISPDNKTGIGSWSEEAFISRFKSFDSDSAKAIPVKQGEFNTIMPWTLFGGMTREDLSAVYTYLHSLKPVNHQVVKFTAAKTSM